MKAYLADAKYKMTSFWLEVKYNNELPMAIGIAFGIVLCFGIGYLFLTPLPLKNSAIIVMCLVGTVSILFNPYFGVLFIIFLYYLMASDIKYVPTDVRVIFYVTPVVGFSWIINMIVKRNYRFVNCPQNFAILGLIACAFLSTINAVYPERSIHDSIVFCKRMLFYLFFLNLIDSVKKLNLTYWTIGGGAGCLALLGVRSFILGSPVRLESGGGQIAGSNQLAHMCDMILPFFFYKIFSKNRWEKIGGIFFFPITLICIIATASRGGTVGLLAVLVLLCLKSKKKLKSLIILGAVIGLGMMFAPPTYWERMQTIKNYEEDASAIGRIESWNAGIRMWQKHPFFGVGQENFQYVLKDYLPYNSMLLSSGEFIVPHNTYIKFLAQGGTFSLFFFLLLLFFNFRDLWLIRRLSKEEFQGVNIHNLTLALEIGIIAHMVSGFFGDRTDFEPFYWFSGLTALIRYFLKHEENMAIKK